MKEMPVSDQRARQDYAAYQAEAADRLRFQVSLVESGLKTLMLVNGGAIVALLTFLGNAADRTLFQWSYLQAGFALFALGVACAMVAHLAAFFSQGCYHEASQFQAWNAQDATADKPPSHDIEPPMAKGAHAEFAGIALAVLGLLAFICGAVLSLWGIIPA